MHICLWCFICYMILFCWETSPPLWKHLSRTCSSQAQQLQFMRRIAAGNKYLKVMHSAVYELVLQERMAMQAPAHQPSCTCVTLFLMLPVLAAEHQLQRSFMRLITSTSKFNIKMLFFTPITFFLPCKQNKLLSLFGTNYAGPMRLKTVLKNKCSISSGFSAYSCQITQGHRN